jgi:hypothetical protein
LSAPVIALSNPRVAVRIFLFVCLLVFGGVACVCAQSEMTPRGGTALLTPFSDTNESSSKTSVPIAHTSNPEDDAAAAPGAPGLVAASSASKAEEGIDWTHLLLDSGSFLMLSHTYRFATEGTTRRSIHQPFFSTYASSVSNLHGWADGDPFMVNYVGHPMEGAVAGFIWQHNDRAYRTIEFGRNRRYWKGRLRGMAFAYVYSTAFEIGPISEASIGHVQSFYPQVGFVDHVITPIIGTGWTIAEDAVDRLVIQRFEAKFGNPWLRMIVRTGLNPARSFANFTEARCPWCREDRPGVFTPFPGPEEWAALSAQRMVSKPVDPPPGVAPFDFTFHTTLRDYVQNGGAGGCMGGGGTAAFRVAAEWQVLLNVDGCKMLGFKENWSGDSLTFAAGPRWTPQIPGGRWLPHVQALAGGTKLTQEFLNTALEAQVANWHPINDEGRAAKHNYYNTQWDTVGFAIQAGAGLDYKLSSALALNVGSLEYAHSWTNDINGFSYRNAIQFSGGLVLHMGTW